MHQDIGHQFSIPTAVDTMNELWSNKATNGMINFLSAYDEWKLDKVACKICYLSSSTNTALVSAYVNGQLTYAWDRNGLPAD